MITTDCINLLEKKIKNKKIAVIGDLMLDGYFWGDVTRISPEAPVPVVEIENEFFRFGGAANVALNLVKLGSEAIPIGTIGNDTEGKVFLDLLNQHSITSKGIFVDNSRPTSTKTRVIAKNQQVVRIDKESKVLINSLIEKSIIDLLKKNISELDGIILQDYNKGVLTPKIIKESIKLALNNSKIISVDPKFSNFKLYKNTTVFKPNRKETEDILGIRISSDAEISKAGNELLKLLKSKYVLLTLGDKGSALFEKGKKEIRIPTKARKVADVSGAGDTVIAVITAALCAGASITEAAYISNYAGGLVCEEVGIVPIDKEKLFSELRKDTNV